MADLTSPAIEFVGATRAYVSTEVADDGQARVDGVHGIDLAVGRGELVAVCGPSGSGKSTLLHLAGALDTPTEGSVRVAGRDLAGLSTTARARVRNTTIGFVFQSFNLVPGLTAGENVALPAVLARKPRAHIDERVASLLDLVDLTSKAASLPSQLSGGEQQRVAVARALVNDPAVLLADEPTGNLDSRAGDLVAELLFAARDAGRTVLVVTHDLRLAARTERVVHLRDGRITHETRPEQRRPRPLGRLLDTAG